MARPTYYDVPLEDIPGPVQLVGHIWLILLMLMAIPSSTSFASIIKMIDLLTFLSPDKLGRSWAEATGPQSSVEFFQKQAHGNTILVPSVLRLHDSLTIQFSREHPFFKNSCLSF